MKGSNVGEQLRFPRKLRGSTVSEQLRFPKKRNGGPFWKSHRMPVRTTSVAATSARYSYTILIMWQGLPQRLGNWRKGAARRSTLLMRKPCARREIFHDHAATRWYPVAAQRLP